MPVNGDFNVTDGYIGGVQTISLSSASFALTSPAGFTPTPSAGPTQAQNAVLKLTGTVTALVTITLPLPGYLIIDTTGLSVTGAGNVILRAVGSGQVIGVPFGNVRQIYNDGTNVQHCNLQEIATYLDVASALVPGWITLCTKPPFLLCDGSTFSNVTYPLLALALSGTTLPDFRGRGAYFLNGGTARLTTAGAGIDGNTLLASGGANGIVLSTSQIPAHTHANTLADPGHLHTQTGQFGSINSGGGAGFQPLLNGGTFNTGTSFTGITITNASVGAGANIPNAAPGTIGGIRMIRAG